MDIIYLLYGLAFVLLGVSVLLLPKAGTSSKLLPVLWLLALFGITHGVKEWVFLLEVLRGQSRPLGTLDLLLLVVSYGFLFEFGRRLVRSCGPVCKLGPWLYPATGPWIYAVPAGGLLLVILLDPANGLALGARYFIGFPGSLLTAMGLLSCVRAESDHIEFGEVSLPFRSAAAAFVVYGVVGGLVVREGNVFPATVFTEARFLSTTGLPVQLFRAGCAALILVTVATIIRVYQGEAKNRLRVALHDARSSLAQIHKAQRHLRQAALVLQNMSEGVVITDARGRIESVNAAFEANTGYRRDEVIGTSGRVLRSPRQDRWFYRGIRTALRQRGRWHGEMWIRRKDTEIHAEWLSINALRDERGEVTNYIGIFFDVETQEGVRQRLHHLAYYDGLTGLPNRQLFRDRLNLILAQARRAREMVALMFVDLDRFKHINDTMGHKTGDRILQLVAQRIEGAVRESDTIARIGGDEFTVILPGIASPLAAAKVARKILGVLESPLVIEGREFYVTASIGISMYPGDGEERDALIRNADIAMYRAKDLGRNGCQVYVEQMSTHMRRRVLLENELRGALERGELYLLYQPQIDLSSGRLVGVEALARWQHPTFGSVPPATFIPIAEETDLIDRIGEWVLRTACRQASSWAAASPNRLRVAVNVSARQLHRKRFADTVAWVLGQTDLSADGLAIELTESVTALHSSVQDNTLRALSDMGVQITIDDFGTGYSSLGYLKRFSVDKLKIDQSFVRDIPTDPNDRALATMIIAMAHASGMRVTAEGVETDEQLDFLRRQGCDEIQGFLVSKPVPAARILDWCERPESLHVF